MATTAQLTEASTSNYVEAGGIRLHYNEAGTGEPLVAIHGGGPGASGWSNFQQNLPTLTEHFRVLLIDLPQYGKSDAPEIHEPTGTFYARTIKNFIDALGLEKVHILGNSLGGMTAMKFAIDYPDNLGKLMVMGAPTGSASFTQPMPTEGLRRLMEAFDNPTKETMHAMIKVFVDDPSFVTDELLEQRVASATDEKKQTARRNSTGGMGDLTPDLGKIKAKTLILWGRDDRIVPLDFAWQLNFRIPDSHLHVFPHCGHWVQYEGRDAFNRLVIDWVENEPD